MNPNPNGSPLWIGLHFSALPLEIFTRSMAATEIASLPIVIIDKQDKQTVCCLNQNARDAGIQTGSNMGTVYAISSEVRVFERDTIKEARALKQLAHWAYQFTPRVSISPPHSLLLDIQGCLKLFRGLNPLKIKITEGLKKSGYSSSLSAGSTPLGALFLAKAGVEDDTGAEMKTALDPLPINHMETEARIIESLHQMGITKMKRLLALPASELSKRYGTSFTRYLKQLTGETPDPRKFISPEPQFLSEISFSHDLSEINPLLFPVKRLLSELCGFLTGRQLTINRFTWLLKHRNHPTKNMPISLAGSENHFPMFFSLTRLQLEKTADIVEIDTLGLTVKTFFPASQVPEDLFQDRGINRNFNEQANMLLNQFNTKLGPEACFGLSLNNDHRPERAWKPVKFAGNDYWTPRQNEAVNPRPLQIFKQPRALNTMGSPPSMNGRLELLSGPERIDFGWWDTQKNKDLKKKDQQETGEIQGPEIQGPRDYYIARHPAGSLYWIFQYQNRWYLHGIFS